jgi:N-acetyl-anhydromuramyl-L-alanine amidase AmpD
MDVKDIRDQLPKHESKKYPKRNIQDINHIDIHHSASPTANYKGVETIEGFARYHINSHGWPGLGYHHVISPDGDIFKTGYASESRWSVGGNNSYTISVMIVGRFDQEEIFDKQYQALLWLVRQLMSAYNVPKENVKGHNEYPGHSSNTCPGINMDKLRSDL